jgi:hypothetical protein
MSNTDEAKAFGLRLMRSRARREELIVLAERTLEEESKHPAEHGD